MFTPDLTSYQIQVKELHRQAAQYRLARSIQKQNPLARKITISAGQKLIHSGEMLISRSHIKG